ncbi:MAG: hypothetical protein EBS05_23690 [Proteobacteria bacterium]|nr:hypothetical protein [Pseudomonadota bacterium]
MNDVLPKSLREAQDKGIEFFSGENCEWKLELEGSARFIEEIVGCPVCAFANNGFGDYLFLKQKAGAGFGEEVFEFFHEGPEIIPTKEDLETLLGLKDRPASADAYPRAVYESGELVQLRDHVQIRVWVEFWKGWQDGKVEYVPGISKKKLEHENCGLKWVAIRLQIGQICPLVSPENGKLKKVRFVRRGHPNDK